MAVVPSIGGGHRHPTETQAKELPSPPAPEDMSATELKDLSSDSLSSVFKALVEKKRDELKDFHPTLATLSKAVSAFHDIGLDGVTLEHADFNNMQKYGLYRDNANDEEPENVTYALLGIYGAVFVARIYPENVIECHAQNANSKVQVYTNNVAKHRFWYKTDSDAEPDFFQYNLGVEEDRIAFASTVLQTAAILCTAAELKEYDVTSTRITAMPKSPAPYPKIK